MKKILLIIFFILSGVPLLTAQVKKITRRTKEPVLYARSDWDIQLVAEWTNPYLQEDIAVDMLLTTPSGKNLILPCYYEKGQSGAISLWKARFAPQEKGAYSYSVRINKKGAPPGMSGAGKFRVRSSTRKGFLYVKDNWVMRFDNGEIFRGVGENICWESRANDDSKYFKTLHENPKYNYENMLRSLASHGGNYFRTWISSFNLPLDWQKGFNSHRYSPTDEYFNPSAIARIDRLFDLSDSLGLYVMLTLGMGAYHTSEGGFSPSAEDFFINPQSKQRYKDRLRYFIARWGYSTSVGAWELFNEVDNVQFRNKEKPISASSIVQWHDEMSAYIKQTDPYGHIVTTSISHRDLEGLNSLEHIDINQKHIYKNTAGIPSTIDQYEREFKKPYVIGEFGYEWDWSKNFDDFAEGMDSDFKRGLWYGLFSPTPVLPLSWWWEYFDNRGTDAYLSKVRVIKDRMLAAANGSFEAINLLNADTSITVYNVKCGEQLFIYAYNPGNAVKKIDLAFDMGKDAGTATAYICETGEDKKVEIIKEENRLKLAGYELPANSDVVFIIQ